MAAVTSYVSNPHTNSTDWATAVTGAGGVITTIDFDNLTAPMPLTVAGDTWALSAYQASDGVSFTGQGRNVSIVNGAGPGDMGTFNQNTGEGTHTVSNYLSFPSPGFTVVATSITVTFDDPVSAVGLFTIDLSAAEPLTIQAFDVNNVSLGSAQSVTSMYFQPRYLYFMGLASDANDIKSFKISGSWQNGYSGDNVAFDTFTFARVPEPATLALLGLGGLGVLFRRKQS